MRRMVTFGFVGLIGIGFSILSCGSLNPFNNSDLQVCYQFADEHYDPENYLEWRGIQNVQRKNSFTHALPCSSDVMEVYIPLRRAMLDVMAHNDTSATKKPVPKVSFGSCSETEVQIYYELIGKYDIFQVGWDDLTDLQTGNTIDIASIDSVESSHSDRRFLYEDCRSGNPDVIR